MGIGCLWRSGRSADSGNPASRTGSGNGLYRAAESGFARPHAGADGFSMTTLLTRRQALAGYEWLLAAASSLRAQRPAGEPPGRIPPVQELLNAAEFEAIAQRKLDSRTFAEITGSERSAFERITFRPRMMVDTTKLDLTIDLFGQSLFTPILVG